MASSKASKTLIAKDIVLYTTREEYQNPIDDLSVSVSTRGSAHNTHFQSFVYDVEITTLKSIDISLNFEGSHNFTIEKEQNGIFTVFLF